jgi:hypothetical protein
MVKQWVTALVKRNNSVIFLTMPQAASLVGAAALMDLLLTPFHTKYSEIVKNIAGSGTCF